MVKALETERLMLTAWSKKDAAALFAYAKNPNVGPHAGWKPHESERESKRIIKEIFLTGMTWKITWKETGQVIGSIGLEEDRHRPFIASKELGYSLSEEFWGRGIMTEAGKAIMDYAFTRLNLIMMAVQTGPDNLRSQSVIEKLGFHYEGTLRQTYRTYDDSVRDARVYSVTKEEWEAKT